MNVLKINGAAGNSTILVGESLQHISRYLPAEDTVIITDGPVRHLYQNRFPSAEVIEIGSGEKIKNLDTVARIYGTLMERETDRSSFILGIGGGIVCDLAGFAASTYMRGLRFGFVATTLLAQVDASVGGKNGINWEGYKNLVGVFNQPEWVICDPELLKTLPGKEVLNGLAEIIKQALIGNAGLLAYLESHVREALALDREVIEKLVTECLLIKTSVVNRDEKEQGERRILNFGHTFGHAIEKITGVSHGEAVAAGMVLAACLSEKMGFLKKEDRERIEALITSVGLPGRIAVPRAKLLEALRKDKKKAGEGIHFVFLQKLGKALVKEVSFSALEAFLKDRC